MTLKLSRLDARAAAITARPKLSPIEAAHDHAVSMGDYVLYDNQTTNLDIRSKLEAVMQCSTAHETAETVFGESAVTKYVCNEPFFCNVCADSISAKRFLQTKPMIEYAISRGYRLVLLTLTTKDCENPIQNIRQLQEGFRKLYLMGQKGRGGEFNKIAGYAGNIEIKSGKHSGLPHIHMHLLCALYEPLDYQIYHATKKKELESYFGAGMVPQCELDKILIHEKYNGIPVSTLSAQWIAATGGTGINIEVSHIKDTSETRIREAFKYPAKMTDFVKQKIPMTQIFELYDAIRSQRLFRRGGMFAARSALAKKLRDVNAGINPFSIPGITITDYSKYAFNPGGTLWTQKEYKRTEPHFECEKPIGENVKFQEYIESGFYESDNRQRGTILSQHNFCRKIVFELTESIIGIVDALKFLKKITSNACRKLNKRYVRETLNIADTFWQWLENRGEYFYKPPPLEQQTKLTLA